MKTSFLKKIKLTCCEATLLMEQQNGNSISFKSLIKLKIHILICKWCEAYNKKLKVIDAKLHFQSQEKTIEISNTQHNDFKEKMNDKLNL